jgi:hypothetical protein
MNANSELIRLRELQKLDWKDLRSNINYTLTTLELPFGKRNVYVVDKEKQALYEDLQSSRGIVNADTINDVIIRNQSEPISLAEVARIEEIQQFIDDGTIQRDEFFELGFRFPRLLSYYSDKFNIVKGCDIVDLNVEVGKSLNFDVVKCDLNSNVPEVSTASLVIAYHVLEHISYPHVTIQCLFDKMKSGACFHVEIPIEPGLPRLRYAHLFPFEEGDISYMCTIAGFTILHTSTKRVKGGPQIERCLVRK